jgi:hypothetical protein
MFFSSLDNAMEVFEETQEANNQRPESEPEPDYPKEVGVKLLLLMFIMAKYMYLRK